MSLGLSKLNKGRKSGRSGGVRGPDTLTTVVCTEEARGCWCPHRLTLVLSEAVDHRLYQSVAPMIGEIAATFC